jgi:hypothetical protein
LLTRTRCTLVSSTTSLQQMLVDCSHKSNTRCKASVAAIWGVGEKVYQAK